MYINVRAYNQYQEKTGNAEPKTRVLRKKIERNGHNRKMPKRMKYTIGVKIIENVPGFQKTRLNQY